MEFFCNFAVLNSDSQKYASMNRMILRYLTFLTGLFFLSLGMVLIVTSTLGTTPISSVNYVLSVNTPMTLGIATFWVNMVLIIGQILLVGIRRETRREIIEILLQIPLSLVFSVFIDMNMAWVSQLAPTGYAEALLLLGAGCLSQAFGVTLELKPNVAIMSGEGFVKYAARRWQWNFGHCKIGFDVTLVALAALCSLLMAGRVEGIREGTVVAALCTGMLVNFISRHILTRRNLHLLTFRR